MGRPLRTLLLADTEDDCVLVSRVLQRSGWDLAVRRVADEPALAGALAENWDLVLSGCCLEGIDALRALEILHRTGKDIPFIVVSGSGSVEQVVQFMKAGAHDYLGKRALNGLPSAVKRGLEEAEQRRRRRQAEEERDRMVVQLEGAVAARDDFLAIVSHELRTPLTTLQLQLQRVGKLGLRALDDALTRMQRQLDQLGRLVREMLDAPELAAGRMAIMREQVDMPELVREVADDLRADDPRAPEVVVQGPEHLEAAVDRLRMEQVVRALLSNALKFGGGKPVTVSLGNLEGTTLAVTDRGEGIDPAAQARIFERFERAVPAKHFGALGMGLWISRRVVEAHGGSIEVRSRRGVGSTFTVHLPG